jgi:dihydropyrimidinase
MTYDRLKIDDRQAQEVLDLARRDNAMVLVHAENHDVIKWITESLLREGRNAPKYHALAHERLAESEATHRAITLARVVDTKILIVHVSGEEAMNEISRAQRQGFSVFGETCPQYLFLSDENLDLDGFEGAKCVCTPPPRGRANQEAIWRGIMTGVFQVVSSDHAPFRFDDPKGKLLNGKNVPFNKIPPGIPGIEVRLPLMFSEGVNRGRISLQRFVEISSTNHAKIYDLHPKKGTIAISSDADIAIWDPEKEQTISQDMLHDNMDYTPYAGIRVKGWPVTSISRGRVLCDHGKLEAEPGQGEFIKRDPTIDAPKKEYSKDNWRSRLD